MPEFNKKLPLTTTNSRPLTLVREKRYDDFQEREIKSYLDGSACRVHNISDTGLAFTSELNYEVNHTATFLLQVSENQKLELKGRIIWRRAEDNMFLYGFHFNNQYLPEGFLAAFDHVALLKEEIQEALNKFYRIDPEFKRLTLEIKTYLGLLKSKLDHLEDQLLVQSEPTKNSYREVIKTNFEKEVVDQLKTFSRELDKLFSPVQDKSLRAEYISFFREQVGVYYSSNPFIGRSLRKPQGYAGDFEMMNQIYRESFEGRTFFEMLMHRYGINESSSLSVKYRQGYFSEKLHKLGETGDSVRILSMASGPAREVVEFLSTVSIADSSKYQIYLVDQDVDALLNAKRNCYEQILRRDLKCEVFFLPISVKEIIEQSPNAQELSPHSFNFIYTAGLYDYLTQPVAQILTQNLLSLIQPEGHLIIGNFHPSNPTKAISELVADWKLIHRSEEDLVNLLAFSKVKSHHLHKDPEGIDLFLEIDV